MGIDTKIYTNHKLTIPSEAVKICELVKDIWKSKIEISPISKKEFEFEKGSINNYKILLDPKLIEFEYHRFKQITLGTNFKYSGVIKIYDKTICFSPIGIGRYHTNMKLYLTSVWMENLNMNKEHFPSLVNAWQEFSEFMYEVSHHLGSTKFIYINDGYFSGIEEIAWNGGSIEEMKKSALKLLKNCESIEEYFEHSDQNIWIYNELRNHGT